MHCQSEFHHVDSEESMIIATRLLKASALYLLAGALLGLFMGIAKDFTLASVHVHIALLGWVAMAFAGIVYFLCPACAASRLASVHFWLHNLALPAMMISLATHAYGYSEAERLLGPSSSLVFLALLFLVFNICLNLRIAPPPNAIPEPQSLLRYQRQQ